MRPTAMFALALLLCLPSGLFADSHAYVLASGTPGSITPFNTATGTLVAAFFVPAGGYIMAVAPGTKQIWEVVASPDCICMGPWAINILDPKSGTTLATLPLSVNATALLFDAAGRFAYMSLGNGDLIKIDVASRRAIRAASLGGPGTYAGMVFSSDGSELFLVPSGTSEIRVIDSKSLTTIASIPVPPSIGSIFVFGSTLLVTNGSTLLYFDTTTLQQTNSAAVPSASGVFGVSPDGSKIYLSSNCCGGTPNTMEIVDFSSGEILVTQVFSNVDLLNLFLSPDAKQIVVASSPVLLVDPNTLATTKTVWSVGIPNSAAYLDPNNLLMLNYYTGGMMVIDQASAQVTDAFPLGLSPLSGEVADTSRDLVYVGGHYYQDGTPNVISAKSNRIVENLPVADGFAPVAIAGNQLYGIVSGGSLVYNLASGASVPLPPPVPPKSGQYVFETAGAVPPNGKTYWVPYGFMGGLSGVAIYSTATNSLVGGIPNLPAIYTVFSPDSSTAYIASPMLVAVFSTTTFQKTATFNYTTTFTSLALSPDGSILYATDEKTIYVLDAATGAEKQMFALPAAVKGTMALSPDGTTLFLTDSKTNTVDLFNTASGQATVVLVPYVPSGVVVLP